MRHLVILGSTGSIGKNTLNVARHLGPERIRIKALAAKNNIELLYAQIQEFQPEVVAVYDTDKALELQRQCPHIKVLKGIEGICAIASLSNNLFVVSAMNSAMGLLPTVEAIKAGNTIGLANKEVLISAGAYICKLAAKHGVELLPMDSEHSAIFQCLQGINKDHVKKVILTASGGPFLKMEKEQLKNVTVTQALKHPNWLMGAKITIDCSTLMNKGFELIEAHWLYGFPVEQLDVVIHPQSIIHSFVETIDSSMLAQLAVPDMRLPIQYALTYPERFPSLIKPLDFRELTKLEFFPPDMDKFRCLALAYDSLRAGGSASCFLNGANEVLVQRFVKGEIPWIGIAQGLDQLLSAHQIVPLTQINDVLAVDAEAQRLAEELKFT